MRSGRDLNEERELIESSIDDGEGVVGTIVSSDLARKERWTSLTHAMLAVTVGVAGMF